MASAAWTGIMAETIPRAATQSVTAVIVAMFPEQVPDFFIACLDF
jgi:hypothetical protein